MSRDSSEAPIGDSYEFFDFIHANKRILLDGAMGTQLGKRGLMSRGQDNLVNPLFQSTTLLPILAQPNAGKPKLIDNLTVFDMAPAAFAAGIAKYLQAGAHLVGGCCGTSPEHIRAVARVLSEK